MLSVMDRTLPTFMYLTSDGSELLVNLDQIKIVDQITHSTVRLMFAPNMTVTVHGEKAVIELLGLLAKSCIITDGTPLPEALAKAIDSPPPG
jgi:hypothetical protein